MLERLIHSMASKLAEIFNSLWGWLLLIGSGCVASVGGHSTAISLVTIVVVGDMVFGVWAAKKQGRYAVSELLRNTISKVAAYYFALLVAILMERVVSWEWFLVTDTFATIIAVTELWSIAGNILIINPRAPFFKLMRGALIGEIARKLGISESAVEQVFKAEDKDEKTNDNNHTTL